MPTLRYEHVFTANKVGAPTSCVCGTDEDLTDHASAVLPHEEN